jgi:hypothetical protein
MRAPAESGLPVYRHRVMDTAADTLIPEPSLYAISAREAHDILMKDVLCALPARRRRNWTIVQSSIVDAGNFLSTAICIVKVRKLHSQHPSLEFVDSTVYSYFR